jgi:hypothetical protein
MRKIQHEPDQSVSQKSLFPEPGDQTERQTVPSAKNAGDLSARSKPSRPKVAREDVRGIQDLLWKEAVLALSQVESFAEETAFQQSLRYSAQLN